MATKNKKYSVLGDEKAFRDRVLAIVGREGPADDDSTGFENWPTGFETFQKVRLYYTNSLENSDKIYEVEIVEDTPNNFSVNFAYGRRGGNLKKGVKGTNLTLTRAKAMLDKLVAEKKSERYTENPDGRTQ